MVPEPALALALAVGLVAVAVLGQTFVGRASFLMHFLQGERDVGENRETERKPMTVTRREA
jgi:hypothetical protein